MLQLDLLRAADVMDHRAGSDGRRTGVCQAKAFEPDRAQLSLYEGMA